MQKAKEIRYAFIHPTQRAIDFSSVLAGISPETAAGFSFVPDRENPDYVIASEFVYENIECAREFFRLASEDKILIFTAGECISPDLNIYDYGVVFDRHLQCDDRFIRIPATSFFGKTDILAEPLAVDNLAALQKTKYCNFIYGNKFSHVMRANLFHKLSEYKRVDSLGKFLNNIKVKEAKKGDDWEGGSIMLKRPYKFSIAAENATFSGYVSEKIMTSFIARTVPVYWGDPSIAEEFNSKAFINCHEYADLDEVLARVIELDNDDDAYFHMLCQPCQTEEQRRVSALQMEKSREFWLNIFSQDIKAAKRAGVGFHPGLYLEFCKMNISKFFDFSRGFSRDETSLPRIIRYLVGSKLLSGKSQQKYTKQLIEQLYYMCLNTYDKSKL